MPPLVLDIWTDGLWNKYVAVTKRECIGYGATLCVINVTCYEYCYYVLSVEVLHLYVCVSVCLFACLSVCLDAGLVPQPGCGGGDCVCL